MMASHHGASAICIVVRGAIPALALASRPRSQHLLFTPLGMGLSAIWLALNSQGNVIHARGRG